MVINLENRKYRLIERIMKLDNDLAISKLEEQIRKIEEEKFWLAVKPMRRNVTVEQLKEEQNYKPISKETFFKDAETLNITEPLDDLLKMLTK